MVALVYVKVPSLRGRLGSINLTILPLFGLVVSALRHREVANCPEVADSVDAKPAPKGHLTSTAYATPQETDQRFKKQFKRALLRMRLMVQAWPS